MSDPPVWQRNEMQQVGTSASRPNHGIHGLAAGTN
jgi:hypothetical protein